MDISTVDLLARGTTTVRGQRILTILITYYRDDGAVIYKDDDKITPVVPLDGPKGHLPTSDQTSIYSFPRRYTLRCAVRPLPQLDHGQLIFRTQQLLLWTTCLRTPPRRQCLNEQDKLLLNASSNPQYLCYTKVSTLHYGMYGRCTHSVQGHGLAIRWCYILSDGQLIPYYLSCSI